MFKAGSDFAIIDDGNWRGIIAPRSKLSAKQLSLLVELLEDTDAQFLAEVHKEYREAKAKGLLISSAKVEKALGLK